MADETPRRSPRDGIHVRVTVPDRAPVIVPASTPLVDERPVEVPVEQPRVEVVPVERWQPVPDEPSELAEPRVVETQETALERFRRYRSERRTERETAAAERRSSPDEAAPTERRSVLPWKRGGERGVEEGVVGDEEKPEREAGAARRWRSPWQRAPDAAGETTEIEVESSEPPTGSAAAERPKRSLLRARLRRAPREEQPVEAGDEAAPTPPPAPPVRGFTTLEVRTITDEEPSDDAPAPADAKALDAPVEEPSGGPRPSLHSRLRKRGAAEAAPTEAAVDVPASTKKEGLLSRFPRRSRRTRTVSPLDIERLPAPPPTPPLPADGVDVEIVGAPTHTTPEPVDVVIEQRAAEPEPAGEARPTKRRGFLRRRDRVEEAREGATHEAEAPEPEVAAETRKRRFGRRTKDRKRSDVEIVPPSSPVMAAMPAADEGPADVDAGEPAQPVMMPPAPVAPEPEPMPAMPDVAPPPNYDDIVRRVERTLQEHRAASPRVLATRRR